MKVLSSVLFLGALLALPAMVTAKDSESVERVIHTDGKPPVRGKGTAVLAKKGNLIEVTLKDLSFHIQWVVANNDTTENIRITGFRIGLLSPKRRAERTGVDWGKRIKWDELPPGGKKFEPKGLKGTFDEEPGAALEGYEACLMILLRVNKGIEGMILAHTAEPAAHREFFPLRKTRPGLPKLPPNPELTALRKDLDASIARLSQPVETLTAQYRDGLANFETKYLESGNLEGVLAAREETEAIGRRKTTDLGDHSELRGVQDTFRKAQARLARETLPKIVQSLKAYQAATNSRAAQLEADGKLEDSRVLRREVEKIQALIDEPEHIPAAFSLPFAGEETSPDQR